MMYQQIPPQLIFRLKGRAIVFGLIVLILFSLSEAASPAIAQEPDSTSAEPLIINQADPPAGQPLANFSVAAAPMLELQGISQPVGNPGLEGGGWSPWQIYDTPALDTNIKHSGSRSADLGNTNNADDQIIQSITIPANATGVTLQFWYRQETTETTAGLDHFYIGLWDQNSSNYYMLLSSNFSQNQPWTLISYNLSAAELASVAGKTVRLGFIVQTNASLPSRAWVDDIGLYISSPNAPQTQRLYLPMILSAGWPIIQNFSANPTTIAPGGAATLSWNVANATSLSISPGIGSVTGSSITVRPAATTRYTLTAANAAGSVTAQTTVTVQNPGATKGFFLPGMPDIKRPTSRPTVAVDGAGGVHVTLAPDSSDENSPTRPAYYAYCPANCTTAAAFTVIPLRDKVTYVNLALDPAGRPRLLLIIGLLAAQPYYEYGECDNNCTNPAQWHFTTLAPYTWPGTASGVEFARNFRLDPQGRPRFIYQDWNEAHKGNFYIYCEGNCTNSANWLEIQLNEDLGAGEFALAFSSTGQPRLAYQTFDRSTGQWFIVYAECNANCTSGGQWSGLRLTDTVSASVYEFAKFALQVDSGGHPRLALYTGSGEGSSLTSRQLHYLSCNAASCAQGANWQALDLKLPRHHGEAGVDLALDAQNRPRLAYHAPLADGYGLYYAWCNNNCETLAQSWQHKEIEPSEHVTQELPIPPWPGCNFPQCNPPIPPCTFSAWDNGFRPSLALDLAGNPRIAYDAEHDQGGACGSFTDTRLTRFMLFSQP